MKKNIKVLVTGGQGFIGSYVCQELLNHNYDVISVDNFSKYGKLTRGHDNHPNFKLYEMDVLSSDFRKIFRNEKPDYVIMLAAMIGGISYFHKYAYDLLATNERINAQTFDACIEGHKEGYLKRVLVYSSSMVFENTETYPTPETDILVSPPPSSTYGFSKLAIEYMAKGAFEQYGLLYSIIRPFNCVGAFEEESISEEVVMSGNIKLMLSHVLPDIINKCLKGQDPLHILGEGNQVRCYTNGRDIAIGTRLVLESDKAINNDFNISIEKGHSVLELAEIVWNKINTGKPFNYVSDKAYEYDVQKRVPDMSKAKNILGFEAKIPLEESIDEVIKYIKSKEIFINT